MSIEAEPVKSQILNTWFGSVNRDNAAWAAQQIGKAWMTLAIVQLVVALYAYLLPQLPLSLSGMSLQHVLYAPALFVLGFLYAAIRIRIIRLVIALAFLVLIAGESYYYVIEHQAMIQVDLDWYALTLAGIWRFILLLLSLRGIQAALLAR
jgi:hypothetical protein